MKGTQRERIEKKISDRYGCQVEYLWESSPTSGPVRRGDNRKWFGAFLSVSGDRVGLETKETVQLLNVKCHPIMIGSLLGEKGYLPAYHMNKTNWVSILLDGTLPDGDIMALVDQSYDAVAPKRPEKRSRSQ